MTAHAPPLLSVVVPVVDEERLVPDAIGSIRRQGDAHIEIIAVHGPSTDGTGAELERLAREPGAPLHIVPKSENEGAGAARNLGVRAARGALLAFLDADDLWSDGWLRTARAALDAHEDALVLGHTAVVRRADSPEPGSWGAPEPPVVAFSFGATALRRATFEVLGGIDPSLRFGEDIAFFLVARERGVPVVTVPETTLFYRLHERNSVNGRGVRELNVLRVLRDSLKRRQDERGTIRALPALQGAGGPGSTR